MRWRYTPPARVPRKLNHAQEQRRLGDELWARIDGRIPRSEVVSASERRTGDDLWARIDGRAARHEHDEDWIDLVADVHEVHERWRAWSRKG